jgi:DNA-binding transcriptional LysR family regulator
MLVLFAEQKLIMTDTLVTPTQRRFLPSFAVLRSFEAAARHESFTAAAEELNLTQSAVSRQIKELETAIGVELFARVGRRVRLTEAGDAFAQELGADLERIRQTVFRAVAAGDFNKALRVATCRHLHQDGLSPDCQSLKTKTQLFKLTSRHVRTDLT